MCQQCYDEAERPWQPSPLVDDGVNAIQDLYALRITGGALHIVTDDDNIEDECIDFCLNELHVYEDEPEAGAIAMQAALLLRQMSEDERWTALAIVWGYSRPGEA